MAIAVASLARAVFPVNKQAKGGEFKQNHQAKRERERERERFSYLLPPIPCPPANFKEKVNIRFSAFAVISGARATSFNKG